MCCITFLELRYVGFTKLVWIEFCVIIVQWSDYIREKVESC